MPESPPISLKQIADEAGVSAMTVSRVLRKSPQVSPDTRQRVLQAAERLGYRPDPHVTQLMEHVRRRRLTGQRATLAHVYDHPAAATDIHNYVSLEHIRARADGHGYRVDSFRLGPGGVSARRLRDILRTRGIRGVLLSVNALARTSTELDYSELATVTFGFGLDGPSLHRASTNVTQGMLDIFVQLESRGYRRIGMAITPWADQRAGHTYSGALLHHQQSLPVSRRLPMLLLSSPEQEQNRLSFEAWMRKHRPDVLISVHEPVVHWLQNLGLNLPKDIGLLVHDWLPAMQGLAGMDHRRPEVAAAAVDLLAAHLQHHEYGLPEVPRQILIPPAFIEGASLRPVT
ncbi:LacI family DNA-binding transcriptional regulator [Ruficoccus amylovorans]|uniref:LacI family DNA-binding transcriptional regulator n=1 Tax=Ruficoccus amylovorans TaxID=1804625 RepID=A0A842HFK2_9BACT|nr:LacI family DNA-binding transcriptional regulator [Ruficoccus amylovorans]MBC2594071.1 LacI family DNA-binding transcriptional regulator [Ruficoccus amylovorans]